MILGFKVDHRMALNDHKFLNTHSSVSFSSPNLSLVVTAFKYTREGKKGAFNTPTEFVDRIFGSKALYYDTRDSNEGKGRNITSAEIEEAQGRFQNTFSLRSLQASPACYVTMLGQAYFVTNDERNYKRTMIKTLNNSNAIGLARISVSKDLKWNCHYRDMLKLNDRLAIIYYYCPLLEKSKCLNFENSVPKNGRLAVHLSMPVLAINSKQKMVNINFYAKPFWEGRSKFLNSQLAVCTVMPYYSSVPEKSIVQGAILHDWALYHLALGFKVVIYDRNGNHKQHLFKDFKYKNNVRDEINKNTADLFDNLIYHDYTILQMIDKSTNTTSYDNTEMVGENRRKLIKKEDAKSHKSMSKY